MSGVRSAAAPQDWARVAAWVAAQGHRLDTGDVRQFAGGLANLNYQLLLDSAPAVFRRPPPGPTAEGANDMAREWRVLSRLNAGYPLAPRGLLFCEDASVIGVPFQLIEFRPGIAVGGVLPDGLPPDAPSRLTSALLEAMARLHALDPALVDLATLGKPDGFLARQLGGWERRAAAVWPQGLPDDATRLIALLGAAVPEPAGMSLLHMDLKFDNLLVDPASLHVTAVIDWDMATRGCPLFDLAVLLSYWVEPRDPEDVKPLLQVPSLAPGFGTRAQVAAAYFSASGRPPVDLCWHVALARLRLAVAWMQLYRLWQAGALTGARYQGFETLALGILRWAHITFERGDT